MKLLLFVMSLMSFVLYRAEKLQVNLEGTWKGSYQSNQRTNNIRIIFLRNGMVELYRDGMNNGNKTIGVYTANSKNEIIISSNRPEDKTNSFILNGKLNNEGNSVNGKWGSMDHSKGSFYLVKTNPEYKSNP